MLDFLGAGFAFFLPVYAHHLVDAAFDIGLQMREAAGDLIPGEVPVTVVHRLELGSPSMATQSPFSTPIRRQSSTNCAQVLRIAPPFVHRKSAMVLWSGTSLPVSHITSTFPSGLALEATTGGMRFR